MWDQASLDKSVLDSFRQAAGYARLYDEKTPAGHFFTSRVKAIDLMLRDCEREIILDVGCGPGIMARHLSDGRSMVFGLDLSPEMIEECAKSMSPSGPMFLRGRAEQLPFPDETFDIVLAMGVLEYVPDLNRLIQELGRVTKGGGVLIASMLNGRSLYRIWGRTVYRAAKLLKEGIMRQRRSRQGIEKFYSERKVNALIESKGFEVLETHYYDPNIFLPPLDHYMPRRSIRASMRIEQIRHGRIKCLRTGFVVKAKKRQRHSLVSTE